MFYVVLRGTPLCKAPAELEQYLTFVTVYAGVFLSELKWQVMRQCIVVSMNTTHLIVRYVCTK